MGKLVKLYESQSSCPYDLSSLKWKIEEIESSRLVLFLSDETPVFGVSYLTFEGTFSDTVLIADVGINPVFHREKDSPTFLEEFEAIMRKKEIKTIEVICYSQDYQFWQSQEYQFRRFKRHKSPLILRSSALEKKL